MSADFERSPQYYWARITSEVVQAECACSIRGILRRQRIGIGCELKVWIGREMDYPFVYNIVSDSRNIGLGNLY